MLWPEPFCPVTTITGGRQSVTNHFSGQSLAIKLFGKQRNAARYHYVRAYMPFIESFDETRAPRNNAAPRPGLDDARLRLWNSASDAQSAITAIVERHRQRLVNHARKIVRSTSLAEDCVQEAWLQMLAAWDTVRNADHAIGRLNRCVRNNAIDILRLRKGITQPDELEGFELEHSVAYWQDDEAPHAKRATVLLEWVKTQCAPADAKVLSTWESLMEARLKDGLSADI